MARSVEFFLSHRNDFVGLDLAGNEGNYPCRLYEEAFEPAVVAEAPITIHAGEAAGPENIWEAIELLGARRIGHGIRAIDDPELVRALTSRQICLGAHPTSNWITQAVRQLSEHPLKRLIDAGVPTCINTDDPGIFGLTLPHEFEVARHTIGLTAEDLSGCQTWAERARFTA